MFNNLICYIYVPLSSTLSMKLDVGFLNLLFWADNFPMGMGVNLSSVL